MSKKCSVDGCERGHFANGLCQPHNRREWKRKNGKGVLPVDAPITQPRPAAKRQGIRFAPEVEETIENELGEGETFYSKVQEIVAEWAKRRNRARASDAHA